MTTSETFRVRSELTPEERTPFVKVFGPELTDDRLTSDEKVLLWYLRFRSNSNFGPGEDDGETFMSWKRIAVELGKGESTIRKMSARLKELNLIKCETRGFGRSQDKIIARPSSIYSPDVFSEKFHGLVKGKLDDAKINVLRSIDNVKQDPSCSDQSGMVDNEKDDPIRSDQSAHTALPVALRPLGSERSYVDLEYTDLGNKTALASLVHAKVENPDQTGEERRDVVLPTLSSGGTRPAVDPRDADLRRAQDSVVQVAARAARKSQEALEKSAAKKAQAEKTGAAAQLRRDREQARIENQTVGGRFYEWAQEEYERFFPKIRMGKWMASEFSQLKALLGAYDNDEVLVRKGWSYCCENWEELTKKLKIADSAPTIGFLLALRSRVFPLVQSQKTDRQAIERQPVKTKIGEW